MGMIVMPRVVTCVGGWLPVVLVVLLLTLFDNGMVVGPLGAQQSVRDPAAGSISGRVVDAQSLAPLSGASVLVDQLDDNGVATNSGGPFRGAVTGPSGEYRFERLPLGRYRIRVERLGYQQNAVEVDLATTSSTRISVGLELAPVALPALEVTGEPSQTFVRTRAPEADVVGVRGLVSRLRQERYLVGDARELTHSDLIEAVTLGETDLFRALQRIPGVSTRDDYTATMWTRGATWDHTRVYFDGLPLYNPTHAGWLFSAVNPDAIGSASFHPGHRSAQWGEGTAAVLDLRSRKGMPGLVNGNAEVSVASARASLDGQLLDGQIGWMVAGRRTYVDLLGRVAQRVWRDEDFAIPYDFSDVVVRVDGRFARGWGFEVSGITEYDYLRGDVPGLLEGNLGQWGNRAGRATLIAPLAGLEARVTAGETRFATAVTEIHPDSGFLRGATLPSLENSINHRVLGVELAPRHGSSDPRPWAVGYQMVRDTLRYDGPFSLLGVLTAIVRDSVSLRPFEFQNALRFQVLWGERRWEPTDRLTLLTGVRMEFGDSVFNGGRLRVGPRLAIRYQLDPFTGISGGWSRSYQYTQDVAPAAGPVGPQLHLSAIWLLANRAEIYPAVRTDIMTLALERWLSEEWLAGVNLYRRNATGVKIPNPEPGVILSGRDPHAEADNQAHGFEFSLRRVTGRWTGSLGYALGESEMISLQRPGIGTGYRFPSPADVRHTLDLTSMVRVRGGLRLGGAFTYASGIPFTRLALPREELPDVPPILQEPNALRTRSYQSLDLMLDHGVNVRGWRVTGFAQLRNALNRNNSVTYAGSVSCEPLPAILFREVRETGCQPGQEWDDRFERGLARLPLVGLRIAF